jgi:kumamolisin
VLTNGNFENYYDHWQEQTITDADIITNDLPRNGTYSALFGVLHNSDDNLWQTVTIPANATRADLSYWWQVVTEDETGIDHDFFYAQIRNESGSILATLDTMTNRTERDVWRNTTKSLLQFKGQTVRVHFRGTTDATLLTGFAVDDITLQACP